LATYSMQVHVYLWLYQVYVHFYQRSLVISDMPLLM